MTARHCSRCGARMILADIGGRQRAQCAACGFVAWRNPAPVAMTIIEHERQLVLIRRAEAPLAGHWAPPAGYVECGESVPEAALREAREECGLEIALDGLAGVYSQADVDVLIVAYRAHSTGGQLVAGDDASEAGLFAPGRLPAQHAPAAATATERWLHRVILDVTAPWPQAAPLKTMDDGRDPTAGPFPVLPQQLLAYLRPGAPALMLTTGADGHAGCAYTWVVALDGARLRLGVDLGSSTLENLRRDGRVSIQVIGPDGLSYLLKGTVRPLKERIAAAAPAAIMLWEMAVAVAKDQSWPGVTTTALAFQWPAERRAAMLAMERAVYAEMRGDPEPSPAPDGRIAE